MIKANITTSILTAYKEYLNRKACGIQVQKIYIEKTVSFEESEEVRAGKWFEFMVLGTKNRDGSEPSPVFTASKGVPAAITKHLTGQIENYNNIYSSITKIETSKILEVEYNGYKFKGILDVLAKNTEYGIHIRDIKCTGFLNNKYDSFGWDCFLGNGTFLPEKKHINQAKFYTWLWFELTGEIAVFVFDVFSNNNPNECSIKKISFSKEAIYSFKDNYIMLTEKLDNELQVGLKAVPEMNRCKKCPVLDCEHKTLLPEVEEYFVG